MIQWLYVDGRAQFNKITSLHDLREYRLRKTVARMQGALESADLDGVEWIGGKPKLADAFKKYNED